MAQFPAILSFAEIYDEDLPAVGPWALNIAKLARAGVPVPQGFVITIEADPKFHKREIFSAYSRLSGLLGYSPVCIRTEKGTNKVRGEAVVFDAIRRSLPAMVYKPPKAKLQGRLFTIDPDKDDFNKIAIEAGESLPEDLEDELLILAQRIQNVLYFPQEARWCWDGKQFVIMESRDIAAGPPEGVKRTKSKREENKKYRFQALATKIFSITGESIHADGAGPLDAEEGEIVRLCGSLHPNPVIYAPCGQIKPEMISVIRSEYNNLWLAIPPVHAPHELSKIISMLYEHRILKAETFRIFASAALPVNAIEPKSFFVEGIAGVIVYPDALAETLTGTDAFDKRPSVTDWAVRRVLKEAGRTGMMSIVAGTYPSHSEDFLEKLIKWGASAVSVEDKAFSRVREVVAREERRLIY